MAIVPKERNNTIGNEAAQCRVVLQVALMQHFEYTLEHFAGIHLTALALCLKSSRAHLIVDLARLLVAKHLVRLTDGLELHSDTIGV